MDIFKIDESVADLDDRVDKRLVTVLFLFVRSFPDQFLAQEWRDQPREGKWTAIPTLANRPMAFPAPHIAISPNHLTCGGLCDHLSFLAICKKLVAAPS